MTNANLVALAKKTSPKDYSNQEKYKKKFTPKLKEKKNLIQIEAFDLANIAKMQEILARQNLVDLISFESFNLSLRTEEHWIKVTQKYSYAFVFAYALMHNGQLKVIVEGLQAPINLTKMDIQAFRSALSKEINPIYQQAIIEIVYSDKYDKPLPVYDFKCNRFTGERTPQMWV
jgi:hypothetical protein